MVALRPADSFEAARWAGEAAAGRDSPVVGRLGNPVAAAVLDSLAEPVGRGRDRYKA